MATRGWGHNDHPTSPRYDVYWLRVRTFPLNRFRATSPPNSDKGKTSRAPMIRPAGGGETNLAPNVLSTFSLVLLPPAFLRNRIIDTLLLHSRQNSLSEFDLRTAVV